MLFSIICRQKVSGSKNTSPEKPPTINSSLLSHQKQIYPQSFVPRALPLLSPFETHEGTKHVWTTFSDDQIDLNAESPDVLLELLKITRFYVEQGAEFIRLDAIAFLWKKIGTTSIHLEETHLIIQLMRDVLDIIAPDVVLITENECSS